MSNPPPAISKPIPTSSKSSNPPQTSPAVSQTQQFFSHDSGKRPAGARSSSGPRNTQSAKPRHKQGKRFKAYVDEDADAESTIMQNPHGRRGQQSITHLMQFALPPRPQVQHQHRFHHGSGRSSTGRRTWGLGSGYHAVDKARYIHANYRFIVDPRGDYRAQAEDADLHLDWNDVLQIIASSKTQSASCPICLGEPTAPRMAKCGHIFCMPCLIRYMHSDDTDRQHAYEKKPRWKKCPICWDSIYVSETRPVRWYIGQENDAPKEGGDIVLRLIRRKPGNTLAMPRESANTVPRGEATPWYFAAEAMDYSRVMRGSEEYMSEQYDEAIAAVKMLEQEDELMFGEDAEWTGRAIRLLNEWKEKTKGMGNPPAQPAKPEQQQAKPERPPIQFMDSEDGGVPLAAQQRYDAIHTPSNVTEQPIAEEPTPGAQATNDGIVPRTLQEMKQRQYEKPQPAEYFFYQALLHYYLSPLDIRILKSAFGTYNAFPSSILPRIERVSTGHIVDDELRKRVKYLGHLPYGCEVGFLECDWTDTVPPEVLEEFKPHLDRRKRRNEEKETREEKDRIRIEKAAEKEYAAVRRKRPSISNDSFSQPLPGSVTATDPNLTDSSNQDGQTGASPPWANRGTSGFASLASPSTSPNASRTVWGTAAVAPTSPDMHAQLPLDSSVAQDDGWLQGWERDLLDQQDVAAQVEAIHLTDEGGASAGAGGKKGSGGGKKSKKGKKITLMSTTARRAA